MEVILDLVLGVLESVKEWLAVPKIKDCQDINLKDKNNYNH